MCAGNAAFGLEPLQGYEQLKREKRRADKDDE
jgi:hypothetical protein